VRHLGVATEYLCELILPLCLTTSTLPSAESSRNAQGRDVEEEIGTLQPFWHMYWRSRTQSWAARPQQQKRLRDAAAGIVRTGSAFRVAGMEGRAWDDTPRALRVRVVYDERLSRLESDSLVSSCRNVFGSRINIIWGSERWGVVVFQRGGGFHVDIPGAWISEHK
jgi:hypothetical protein